jgi:uncharacterized pyridoxamine 5'-phosphate oxidase family protein
MRIDMDAAEGKAVGAHLRLSGRIFSMQLSVEEAVIERVPLYRKVWQTIDEPQLLVIGRYRMAFEIEPHRASASLRAFIDYDFPVHRR